jgi:glyoxylase-like metal-dependent hydrolase (beta-lactamase superfamily II)
MTMLSIECFTLGPLATNAYLLHKPEENRGIIIDPGMNPQILLERIEKLDIEAILLTHAHFDHIGGVDEIRKRKKCPVYIHKEEAAWLSHPQLNGSTMWPEVAPPISTDPPEHLLEHGQVLEFLGETIQVFHTPGHSPGSVSFLLQDRLFSGDVLFRLSVGRTDLPGGSAEKLFRSIHDILFSFGDETQVFPGHGPGTTIGEEKEHNPFV